LHLPHNKVEKPLACQVLMMGEERYKNNGMREPCVYGEPNVQVGDIVSVRQYFGRHLNAETDLYVLEGRDIEGVLTFVSEVDEPSSVIDNSIETT